MSQGYHSPGFAVSNTLEGILDKRKAEARQATIDELNKRNVESQMDDREMNRKIQMMQAEALAEQRKQMALDKIASNSTMGQEYDYNAEQKIRSLGGDYMLNPAVTGESGAIKGGVLPGVSTSEQSSVPASPLEAAQRIERQAAGPDNLISQAPSTHMASFKGSPEEQEGARQRRAMAAAFSDPNWDKYDPMHRFMIMRDIDPKGTIPSTLFDGPKHSPMFTEWDDLRNLPPEQQGAFNKYMTDDANRKRPAGASIINYGAPQQEIGPDNKPTGRWISFNPKTNSWALTKPGDAGPVLDLQHPGTAGSGSQTQTKVPQAALSQLATLRKPGANTPVSPEAIAQAERNIVFQYPGVSQDLKQAVIGILAHPDRNKAIPELIADIERKSGFKLEPAEIDAIADLLTVIR